MPADAGGRRGAGARTARRPGTGAAGVPSPAPDAAAAAALGAGRLPRFPATASPGVVSIGGPFPNAAARLRSAGRDRDAPRPPARAARALPGCSLSQPAPAPAIALKNVSRRFRSGDADITVLDGVSLEVARGELVAIIGPSGSGKSTLLALLAGLDAPTSGEVWVDGEPLHARSEDDLARWRRGALGFVFQSFQLLDHFTARENVQFPLELLDAPNAEARADALLDAVGLGKRGHHYPRQLSGGEQQRVAVARAFATSPRILLADEPTGNLDGATGARVLETMDALRRDGGTTLVLVTHDPGVAARADRRITLRDGRVVSDERTVPPGVGGPVS